MMNSAIGTIDRNDALEDALASTGGEMNEVFIINYFAFCAGYVGFDKHLWFSHNGRKFDVRVEVVEVLPAAILREQE